MNTELKEVLNKGLMMINPELEKVIGKLEIMFDEISLFNPSLKLVGASDKELIVRHFLDCMAPYNIIKQHLTDAELNFADLGTGAGFPGLVLATAFENFSFTLIDRMARRTGFLENTVVRMGLNRSVHVRTEELENVKDSFDAVTFRAFRPLEDISRELARITNPGGKVFIYKSSDENIREELASLSKNASGIFETEVVDYTVPMLDAKRCLLILKRN